MNKCQNPRRDQGKPEVEEMTNPKEEPMNVCQKCESLSLRDDGSCENGDCCLFRPHQEKCKHEKLVDCSPVCGRVLNRVCEKCDEAFPVNVPPIHQEPSPEGAGPKSWYCRACAEWVPPTQVTYDECHDIRCGGCGGPVEISDHGSKRLYEDGYREGRASLAQELAEYRQQLFSTRDELAICRDERDQCAQELEAEKKKVARLVEIIEQRYQSDDCYCENGDEPGTVDACESCWMMKELREVVPAALTQDKE